MTKVSVIITAYNSMDYLPETLESVLRQTFTDFEILLVDDGSLDGTCLLYTSPSPRDTR